MQKIISPQDFTPLDRRMMERALRLAQRAFAEGEVPVGAVLALGDQILGQGWNQVEALQDATAHAELLAITSAAAEQHAWRLEGSTLYTTLEPCAMCFGAATLSRVERIVFGAPDLRHGACGSWVDLSAQPHPIHAIEVVGGLMQEEAALLMRSFFQQRRAQAKSTALNGE